MSGVWDAQLTLFVAGDSPRSRRAREVLRRALAERGLDPGALELVDVLAEPERTLEHGVFATPALVLRAHGATRSLYGDLSDERGLARFLSGAA